MPVFNGEAYIEAAIRSLQQQTFSDFELVISDNASTDSTITICERLASKDPRIKLVCQPENYGVMANFASVLETATGTYFMWAAADDLWSKNWLSTLLDKAAAYDCAAFGVVSSIDELGKTAPQFSDLRPVHYTGPALWRRISYFMQPALFGKQNAHYALYPRRKINGQMLRDLEDAAQAIDVFFVHNVLRTTEIRHAGPAVMYKRRHALSDGATSGAILKSRTLADRMFKRSLVHMYLKYSSPFERILLLLAFPVCVMRIRLSKLSYLTFRLRRSRNMRPLQDLEAPF